MAKVKAKQRKKMKPVEGWGVVSNTTGILICHRMFHIEAKDEAAKYRKVLCDVRVAKVRISEIAGRKR